MMVVRVVLSCLLSLPVVALAQGVTPVHPVTPSGVRLLPDAFLSADNVAAKTATALHGLTFIWDSSGGNWDRWTGAVTQSGTWTVSVQTVPDPCTFRAKTSVPFSINTATTTQLIAASASNKVYVCALNLVVSAADNIALVEDDTSACASPTAGMAGGTTAGTGWNLAANGGLTLGNGAGTVIVTAATNRYVCFITSSTAQLSGAMTYVLAP